MARLRRTVETWGTVLYFDLASRDVELEKLEAAFMKCSLYVHHVDEVFSTYRDNSVVSRLRRGELLISDAPQDVQEVWRLCEKAK